MPVTAALNPLHDAKILIVDDAPQNLKLLHFILSKAGASVVEAGSAEEARAQIDAHRPDAILLDIMMPDTNGYELCREIKENESTAHIPVIFLSALHEGMDKANAFAVGGSDYVAKPFSPPEVMARVTHQIRMVRMQQELARETHRLSALNLELARSRIETSSLFSALGQNLPGRVLDGKYIVKEQIGSGGYSVVYRAVAVLNQQEVAVKIYRPVDEGFVAQRRARRFRQEKEAVHRICHPNAVSILDSGTTVGNIHYLVMELLSGHPLRSELKQGQPLPLSRCLDVMFPVFSVLVDAHKAGVVHRDIKPENIFLHKSKEGGLEQIKLLDFGIAKLVEVGGWGKTSQTATGEIVGTLMYMSPEQLAGASCDERSDIYSAAVTLYEMLSGHLPFADAMAGRPVDLLARLHQDSRPLLDVNPNLPRAVADVLMGALAREPSVRPDANSFLHALQSAAA